jgi:hypothetical protein
MFPVLTTWNRTDPRSKPLYGSYEGMASDPERSVHASRPTSHACRSCRPTPYLHEATQIVRSRWGTALHQRRARIEETENAIHRPGPR